MANVTIAAGDLRHSVQVQEKTNTRIEGTFSEVWSLKTQTYAKIETLSGRELVEAQQVDGRATKKVTMRFTRTVVPENRIVRGCDIYNVVWVDKVEERNIKTIAYCTQDTA